MLIFKLFRIRKTIKDIKEAKENPVAFAVQELLQPVRLFAILFGIIGGILIIFLGILGYSYALGGPFLGFKIIFWILLLSYLFIFPPALLALQIIKKQIKKWTEGQEPITVQNEPVQHERIQ